MLTKEKLPNRSMRIHFFISTGTKRTPSPWLLLGCGTPVELSVTNTKHLSTILVFLLQPIRPKWLKSELLTCLYIMPQKIRHFPRELWFKDRYKAGAVHVMYAYFGGGLLDTPTLKIATRQRSMSNFVHWRLNRRDSATRYTWRESGSTTEPVWTIWRRGKSCTPEGNRTKISPSTSTYSGYSDYGTLSHIKTQNFPQYLHYRNHVNCPSFHPNNRHTQIHVNRLQACERNQSKPEKGS